MQNIEVVDMLIKLSADIDRVGVEYGLTALVRACHNGQNEI